MIKLPSVILCSSSLTPPIHSTSRNTMPSSACSMGLNNAEIFASRSHFDYSSKTEVRTMASALAANHLYLSSLHGPTSRNLSATRESASPVSICEVERVRRIALPVDRYHPNP